MVPLARQELRIARMIIAGLRQPEIAAELGIATNTVKTYVARIRAKTGYQRELAQLCFEVFLERMLSDAQTYEFRPGATCAAAVFAYVQHSPELSDAVRLMRAGFSDWRFERTFTDGGERCTEWRVRDGEFATIRSGHLHYRSEILNLNEGVAG